MRLHNKFYHLFRPAFVALAAFTLTSMAVAGHPHGCDLPGEGCECPGCQAYFDAVEGDEFGADDMAPLDMSPLDMSPATPSADESLLAAGFGATAGVPGAVPSMIGDFFGNNYLYAFSNPNGTTVAVAGAARRFKYAENTNPFPTDRVFFNYNYFDDPLLDLNGRYRDLNRFTFGLEKACCDGLFSVEFRVPFSAGLNHIQEFSDPNSQASEFGNVTLATKLLVYQSDCAAVATGLGIIFPTGNDSVVSDLRNTIIVFENSSLFLQPFIGIYHAPTNRLFHQFLAQVDFDVSGSDVIIPPDSFLSVGNTNRPEVSRLTSQALLYLDYQVGYWAYRKPCATFLTGIAPLVELHYTSTLENLDLGPFGSRDRIPVFVENFRRDILNLTSGVYLALGQATSLKLAGVAPLLEDRIFDAEFGLQLVHRY